MHITSGITCAKQTFRALNSTAIFVILMQLVLSLLYVWGHQALNNDKLYNVSIYLVPIPILSSNAQDMRKCKTGLYTPCHTWILAAATANQR